MSRYNETPTKSKHDEKTGGYSNAKRNLFRNGGGQRGLSWITRSGDDLDVHSPTVLHQRNVASLEFVNFVTILGPARQGKSFLLNCLVGDDEFDIADTIGVCTKGVQVSNTVEPVNNNGCFICVDTEGQGDEDIDSDATLLTPVLLLSKVVLFNWKGGLQKNKILDELAILVEVGNCVSSKNFGDGSPIFGHLHIVLRDFHFDGTADEAFDKIFEEENQRGGQVRERNKIREKLLSSFESIQVWIFPAPCQDVNELTPDDISKEFEDCVTSLKKEILKQTKEPRHFGNIVIDSESAEDLVRRFVEVLKTGNVVHLRSVVSEIQRRKIDAAKQSFQENLVDAFQAINIPVKKEIAEILTCKRDDLLREFEEATAPIDLEDVYRDEIYQQLEEFSDREIEAKRRENQLGIQSKEIKERKVLGKAIEEFRTAFETKLTTRNDEKSVTQLQQDLESYKEKLVKAFVESTENLQWISSEEIKEEQEKLQKWSTRKLNDKIEEKRLEERRKEEAEARRREMEIERQFQQSMYTQSSQPYMSPNVPSYFSSPSYSSSPRHSSTTPNLKFYKGGQFTPGGGRAPTGGCYMPPPSTSSTRSSSGSSGGGTFYKGGQFLPGGGRAPKGGCRR